MDFLIYILVGLACGFVDSSLGMGYGVTATSVLVTFGIAPAIASASIHTSEGIIDIVSGISHWKLGNLEKYYFWRLIIPGIIGAILGATVLSYLSLAIAKPFVSGVLCILGLSIFLRFLKKKMPTKRIPIKYLPPLGLLSAFIDVSCGGGWGPILTPVFVLGGSEPRKAIGTVEITEPIISFTAVFTFGLLIGFESFMWSMVIPTIIGGILLTPLAAYFSKKIPKRFLGVLIGFWLVILNARTILLMVI